MTKTRPAPLGATSDLELNQLGRTSRLYVAPNGASRVLFNPSYKDFAPTELCRGTAKGGLRVASLESVEEAKLEKLLAVSHIKPS